MTTDVASRKHLRGFASLSKERCREIARLRRIVQVFDKCGIMETYEARLDALLTRLASRLEPVRRLIAMTRLYHAARKKQTTPQKLSHLDHDCHCLGKICSKCKALLCCLSFTKDKQKKDGLHPSCKKCHKAPPKPYQLEMLFEHASDLCMCPGKRCTKCEKLRCIGLFDHDKQRKDGYHPSCKLCSKAYKEANSERIIPSRKQYYATHQEELRAKKAVYRATHPEKDREYAIRYHRRHRARIIQRQRAWHFAHRDQNLARYKRYRARHRDAILAREKAYRQANWGRLRAYEKAYRTQNQERLRERRREESYRQVARHYRETNRLRLREHKRAYKHRRRALLSRSGGSYTPQEWADLKAKYNFTCLCCGESEPAIKLTPDHVIPIAKLGPNDISNIQPLCLFCNMSKGAKTRDYRPLYQSNKETTLWDNLQ